MQSTGQTSMQDMSLTSMQALLITYAIVFPSLKLASRPGTVGSFFHLPAPSYYHLGGAATDRKLAVGGVLRGSRFPVRSGVIPMRALRSRDHLKSSMTLSAIAILGGRM